MSGKTQQNEAIVALPESVNDALMCILKEEKRRRIHDYGMDQLDAVREYRLAVARLHNGTLCICASCGGMISMKRALLDNGPFSLTCRDSCSYDLVMRSLYTKIVEVSGGLQAKKDLASEDLLSNEAAKGEAADAFTSQDINLRILQNSEKHLNRLQERRNFLEKNPEDFDVCGVCEEKIPLDRLISNPETGLCRACKPNSKDTARNGKSGRIRIGIT